MIKSFWNGKNVLFIGDSITASKEYPKVIEERLGISARYHCKNGAHIACMVDGERGRDGIYDKQSDKDGVLRPLSAEEVRDVELIVFLGGYNNILYGGYNGRSSSPGKIGDLYRPDGSGQDTIAGVMQYAIERIYEVLNEANNPHCRILIVTVDCTGKNAWVNADGNSEFPKGSGKSYKNTALIQKAVAEANSLPCCDLFHTSGINKFSWCCFAAESEAENAQYSPFPINENGDRISDDYIEYEHGKAYLQHRGDKVVSEVYEGYAPYPYNRDQLHKSPAGYRRIGETVLGSIISCFGI